MLSAAGRLYLLKIATGQIPVETIKVGLYSNSVVWTKDTVLADLTELAQSGYARQTTGAWSIPAPNAGGDGVTTAAAVTFNNNSGAAVTATGFFYVTTTTGVFLGGDAFAAPLTIPATVGTLSVNPSIVDNTLP